MDIIEAIKYIIPALLVLITSYLLLAKFLQNEDKRRNFDLNKTSLSIITPIRLRAYERLILVLERTLPSVIILNTIKPEMTNLELQTELLSNIRNEFSHNISQQIYVSDELWSLISSAQEELLKHVNICGLDCKPENSGVELAEKIIKNYNSNQLVSSKQALSKLKSEVRIYLKP